MFNKKRISILLASIMAFTVLATGCQNAKTPKKEVAAKEVEVEATKDVIQEELAVKLSDWEGTWNNMGAYLEDEELQEAFKDLAEKEDVSVEEAKSAYIKKRHCDFDGLIIEDNKFIILDGFKDNDGKEIENIEYEFKETRIINNGTRDTTWQVFESNHDGNYKFLLMIPVHGEENLTHFHFRYGNELEELFAIEGWFPTFIKPNASYEQLHGEISD